MPYEVGLIFRDGKPLVYDSGDYPRVQEQALALADYDGFRERQQAALDEGRFIGIGIANYVEGTGLGPFEGVTVRVLPSGKVAVATGATNQGQGTRTTLSQIVAEQIGCRLEDIVMTIGDTGAIAQGVGAFASRQAVNAGSLGADRRPGGARANHRTCGAHAWRARRATVDLEDGQAIAQRGNKPSIGFGELARLAQGIPGVSLAGRAGRRPRAHRLLHADAGRLLLRHARRRSPGRRHDRRREDSQIHRRPRCRTRDQSADRRRSGARRRRSRHRQCAA